VTQIDNGILLCTDLDRTVLPNGPWEESPGARPLLWGIAGRKELTLAYVSGRHKALLLEAIETYGLPEPDYAVGDVGTTIYEVADGQWHPWAAWSEAIAPDWQGMDQAGIAALFDDITELDLQEAEKQNRFKLSYYAPEDLDRVDLFAEMGRRLEARGIRASLIWSIDEILRVGLVDVLPARATKVHAIRFLMEHKGFSDARTVFAGDSGNDLPALTSGLQAVLVRNARDDVREEALSELAARGLSHRLYVARGDFLGMNGNYSAGVLEGLAHFLPETRRWMDDLQ